MGVRAFTAHCHVAACLPLRRPVSPPKPKVRKKRAGPRADPKELMKQHAQRERERVAADAAK